MTAAKIWDHETGLVSGSFSWSQSRQTSTALWSRNQDQGGKNYFCGYIGGGAGQGQLIGNVDTLRWY